MTKAEKDIIAAREDYERWYGRNEQPVDVTVELEMLADGDETMTAEVELAFGTEHETENSFDVVNSWDDLQARGARGAMKKYGYRVLRVLDCSSPNPIVYHGAHS